MRDTICILDFGSQYTHLIANRIRRLGVFTEIHEPEVLIEKIQSAKGIILSGGPNDVNDPRSPQVDPKVFSLGIPVLGVCYGHQLLAHHFGGTVQSGTTSEYGRARIEIVDQGTLLKGLLPTEEVWMSHGDSVTAVPKGFTLLARSDDCPVSAMEDAERNLYSIQFHAEVAHTLHGMRILGNFVFTICKCTKSWSMDEYLNQITREIKKTVAGKNVFLLVSGGVDSMVAFALLEKALGKEKVYGLHIDTGFMRKNESVEIQHALTKAGFDNLHYIDASERFVQAVADIADPEKKRRIIGEVFLSVATDAMKELKLNPEEWILAQGTIYPDTIETGRTKHADTIKTHHNRVPAAQKLILAGKIIEPLSELYKDEVRELGTKLGLPAAIVKRQPFPGPGLAVRVLCSGSAAVLVDTKLQTAVEEIAMSHKLRARVLPVKSVGVQGDNRTYAHPAVLIGNEGWSTLDRASRDITNNIRSINRVVWWCESEAMMGVRDMLPDFRLEKAHLTAERLQLAREADAAVHEVMRANDLEHDIWQFPVVLLPITFSDGTTTGEAAVLRPIESREAMTANFYHMERRVLDEMLMKLEALKGISAVFYDVTNKPPGTIEWE